MDLPVMGFDRVAQLAGLIRCSNGRDRERLMRRLEKLVEAMTFLERLRGMRWPPLGEDDFRG